MFAIDCVGSLRESAACAASADVRSVQSGEGPKEAAVLSKRICITQPLRAAAAVERVLCLPKLCYICPAFGCCKYFPSHLVSGSDILFDIHRETACGNRAGPGSRCALRHFSVLPAGASAHRVAASSWGHVGSCALFCAATVNVPLQDRLTACPLQPGSIFSPACRAQAGELQKLWMAPRSLGTTTDHRTPLAPPDASAPDASCPQDALPQFSVINGTLPSTRARPRTFAATSDLGGGNTCGFASAQVARCVAMPCLAVLPTPPCVRGQPGVRNGSRVVAITVSGCEAPLRHVRGVR